MGLPSRTPTQTSQCHQKARTKSRHVDNNKYHFATAEDRYQRPTTRAKCDSTSMDLGMNQYTFSPPGRTGVSAQQALSPGPGFYLSEMDANCRVVGRNRSIPGSAPYFTARTHRRMALWLVAALGFFVLLSQPPVSRCQTDIDECASDPCQNNATCHDRVDGYFCNCTGNFTGANCEVSVSTFYLFQFNILKIKKEIKKIPLMINLIS